jgi:hypothetical protein
MKKDAFRRMNKDLSSEQERSLAVEQLQRWQWLARQALWGIELRTDAGHEPTEAMKFAVEQLTLIVKDTPVIKARVAGWGSLLGDGS